MSKSVVFLCVFARSKGEMSKSVESKSVVFLCVFARSKGEMSKSVEFSVFFKLCRARVFQLSRAYFS